MSFFGPGLPEPSAAIRQSALSFAEIVQSYIHAGFDRDEAINIALEMVRISKTNDSEQQ